MPPLPEPLVGPEVDISGYDWFPLYPDRLKSSRFWIRASDAVKIASLDLWCAAYREVPAGSVPDDDVWLAEKAGFGRRNVDDFLAIKSEIIGPWTLCSDGRFYHPVVCEIAIEQFERLDKRRAEGRERQRRRRDRLKGNQGDAKGVARDENKGNEDLTRDEPTKGKERKGEEKKESRGREEKPAENAITLETVGGPESMTLADYFADEKNRVFAKYPISPEKRKANVWHMAKGVLEAFGSSKAAAGKLVGEISRDYSLTDDELGNIALRIFEAKPTAPRPFAIGCAKQIARERQALEERKGTATTISADDLAYQRRVMAEYVARPASWPSREFNGWPGSQTCMIEPEILVEFGYEVPSWRALA